MSWLTGGKKQIIYLYNKYIFILALEATVKFYDNNKTWYKGEKRIHSLVILFCKIKHFKPLYILGDSCPYICVSNHWCAGLTF